MYMEAAMQPRLYARLRTLEGFFGGLWKKKENGAEQKEGDPGGVVGVQSGAQQNKALQDDGERDEGELGRPTVEPDSTESKQGEDGGEGVQQGRERGKSCGDVMQKEVEEPRQSEEKRGGREHRGEGRGLRVGARRAEEGRADSGDQGREKKRGVGEGVGEGRLRNQEQESSDGGERRPGACSEA